MYVKSKQFIMTVLLGALSVGCSSRALVQSPADLLPDGWKFDGAVEGRDHVRSRQGTNGSPIIVIEKKSYYQADKFLQVYRHFSTENLRGKRIAAKYGVAMKLNDAGVPTRDLPKGVIVTRVQCNVPLVGPRSIYVARMPITEDDAERRWMGGFEFNVPSDALDCTLGFEIDRPMLMMIGDMKFEEVKAIPAAKPGGFPLPASSSGLPALELSPPDAGK
jgi:hypothetical protein